jgi:cephalosporin hydroxylase
LDCGSGDINGNNRHLFTNCNYTGIDIVRGTNVDIVSAIANYHLDRKYNTIISTECLEHDMEYVASLKNIVNLLELGGLLVLTCASTGRAEHGTTRQHPDCSLTTQIIDHNSWYPNYYKNLTAEDIQQAIPVYLLFNRFYFEYNPISCDLYFWGIRNNTVNYRPNAMSVIFDKHDTDKNSHFHNYPKYYEKYFAPFHLKNKINYLEIGVWKGESLRAFREYLPNALHVVGIDIDNNCISNQDVNSNISIEIGSQNNIELLTQISAKYNGFDIVLDDGSHKLNDVIASFETLFPLLRTGGIYIVENTVVYNSPQHCGNTSVNHLSYFTKYFSGLNRWFGGPIDPEKIPKSDNEFDNMIESITYGISHKEHYLGRTT